MKLLDTLLDRHEFESQWGDPFCKHCHRYAGDHHRPAWLLAIVCFPVRLWRWLWQ